MKTKKRYLWPSDYMADPSVHVFDGKLYIYPSHDWESGIPDDDFGSEYDMKDYHVLSLEGPDPMSSPVKDNGVALKREDIAWAGRQLWDCDVARKDGKYYLYFPMKDRNDVFHFGVAVADNPCGPFVPQPDPMRGSYSIDVCVFEENGEHYFYFGGIWGGQLQRYRDNKALDTGSTLPKDDEPALCAKVARLSGDMLQFAEEPRDVVILDELTIATSMELLSVDEVLDLLSERNPATEVIITGRYAPQQLIDAADLVTDMQEVKHYYTQGVLSRPGIDR